MTRRCPSCRAVMEIHTDKPGGCRNYRCPDGHGEVSLSVEAAEREREAERERNK